MPHDDNHPRRVRSITQADLASIRASLAYLRDEYAAWPGDFQRYRSVHLPGEDPSITMAGGVEISGPQYWQFELLESPDRVWRYEFDGEIMESN